MTGRESPCLLFYSISIKVQIWVIHLATSNLSMFMMKMGRLLLDIKSVPKVLLVVGSGGLCDKASATKRCASDSTCHLSYFGARWPIHTSRL